MKQTQLTSTTKTNNKTISVMDLTNSAKLEINEMPDKETLQDFLNGRVVFNSSTGFFEKLQQDIKQAIVITTINSPRKELEEFVKIKDWTLVCVGDTKTPIPWELDGAIYLSPSDQDKLFPKFSKVLPTFYLHPINRLRPEIRVVPVYEPQAVACFYTNCTLAECLLTYPSAASLALPLQNSIFRTQPNVQIRFYIYIGFLTV